MVKDELGVIVDVWQGEGVPEVEKVAETVSEAVRLLKSVVK